MKPLVPPALSRLAHALLALTLCAACSDPPSEEVFGVDAGVEDTADVPTEAGDALPTTELHILYPSPGAVVSGEVAFSVRLSPAEGAVSFFVDEALIGIDAAPPFAAAWSAERASTGVHTLRVLATWEDAEPMERSLNFVVDRAAPSVTFVEPGGLITGPDPSGMMEVLLAVEDDHALRSVHVKLDDSASVWRLEPPEYSATLDLSDLAPGTYTLHATAVDAAFHAREASQEFLVCQADRLACDFGCVDEAFYANASDHCGGCNIACDASSERCVESACVCNGVRSECDGACIDLRIDAQNCGACGAACEDNEVCAAGECRADIPDGFSVIPRGVFQMGASPSETGASGEEYPQRRVTLTRNFLLGEHEVTQAQWRHFFPVDASTFWNCGDQCPVDSVTWWEALEYTNALSASEGLPACYLLGSCDDLPVGAGRSCRSVYVNAPEQNPLKCEGYRLPTEAEWEYAYRAGTSAATYNGPFRTTRCEANPNVDAIAWYACNAQGPQPVGQLQANAFGVFDMAGNVFEWVWDGWAPYPDTPQTDPTDNGGDFESRAIRGGSWNEHADRIRAATRLGQNSASVSPYLGFRVARTLQGTP